MRRALLSVSDKHGLVPFARGLANLSFEIVSTGGTAAALRDAGIAVTEVSALTGFPEIMDGRVKTLHPAIHGGLLARRGQDDSVLEQHGIGLIDLLAVNLYPFEAVTSRPDCSAPEAIEHIDVGGPAMLRAAAKNHERVTVIVSSDDYEKVLEAYRAGEPSAELKRSLAAKVFQHTARYDALIGAYLEPASVELPGTLALSWRREQTLRYGENPHQRAALYRPLTGRPRTPLAQLQGKPLSFNNLIDTDAALACVNAFEDTACVIVKHANPCGVAIATDTAQAYQRAHRTDPASAFGGIIAFNRPLDVDTAAAIIEQQHVDVIVAPGISAGARDVLRKRRNTRVLESDLTSQEQDVWELRSIEGGLLLQERDRGRPDEQPLKVVTQRAPTAAELADLSFAWTVVKFVKSNAIVYAAGGQAVGIGAGQTSRVMSARIAALKAEEEKLDLLGAVMASDAFFPFKDGVEVAARHGIRAVIQPGGSIRDEEVIRTADEHGMAMVLTGMRHFRH